MNTWHSCHSNPFDVVLLDAQVGSLYSNRDLPTHWPVPWDNLEQQQRGKVKGDASYGMSVLFVLKTE